MLQHRWLNWIPKLRHEIWILAAGRLLSQIGTGFTLFYVPIFFVNQVGFSATTVGIALGSASISGVVGRIWSGTWSDSPQWGRRRTLLLSAAISALADVVLASTYNFPTLVLGNLLMGLGIGLYWPVTEAVVADLTTPEQRNEAFALTRLADSLGLGVGVICGGVWIAWVGNYRALFIADGISFVVFFVVVYFAIAETYQPQEEQNPHQQGWLVALSDLRLMIFVLVNILFPTYISQVQSTIPLYFRNFVSSGDNYIGLPPQVISSLFAWHVIAACLCQLPVARWLNRFMRTRALMISLLLWGLGFELIWLTGFVPHQATFCAACALGVFALATVSYTPSASSFVADLAPIHLRGTYLSINAQCWAIGYLIGPPLGGWALDQSRAVADSFWLAAAVSTAFGIIILRYLEKKVRG